jgi:hypothetical protein
LKKQLELLYEIQKIDTNIKHSEELQKKYHADIQKLEDEYRRSEEQYKAEQEHLANFEKEQRNRERALVDARDLKKKVEERIMSVKTNKEYQAGLHEVETIKLQIKQKEDAILETMDASEAAKSSLKKATESLARAKADVEEKKRQIEVDLTAYLADIEQQKQQRALLAGEIAGDVLADYTRLLKVKHGRALVLAAHEQCTGCSMKIPPQIYNEVVLGEKIKTCPNCNRILFVEQVPQAGAEQNS